MTDIIDLAGQNVLVGEVSDYILWKEERGFRYTTRQKPAETVS